MESLSRCVETETETVTRNAGKPMLVGSARRPIDSQCQDPRAAKVRVTLDISQELYAKLTNLAREMTITRADVLRRSLALLDIAVQARREGKKIGIADRTDQLSTEIIGLDY